MNLNFNCSVCRSGSQVKTLPILPEWTGLVLGLSSKAEYWHQERSSDPSLHFLRRRIGSCEDAEDFRPKTSWNKWNLHHLSNKHLHSYEEGTLQNLEPSSWYAHPSWDPPFKTKVSTYRMVCFVHYFIVHIDVGVSWKGAVIIEFIKLRRNIVILGLEILM